MKFDMDYIAHNNELSETNPYFKLFLTIFAVTQVPLAIGEGILTVIIWDRLKAYKPKLLDKLGALAPNEA